MNGLVYHVVSGQAFFTGLVLLLASFGLAQAARKTWKRWWGLAFALGLILIAASSIAIPLWLLAMAGMATLVWLYLLMRADTSRQRFAALVAAVLWLAVAIGELPYLLIPTLQPVANRGLAVIGDSVTAGMGGEDRSETWPAIIARQHQLQVQDLSHVGETAGSALKRIQNIEIQAPVVMVEIGGNDILGSTSSQQFAADLDALLNRLSTPGRQIVMYELPLPPFYHEFGRIQRSLAHKYGVQLIPRRIFLSLLADQGATLDSIHLSQAGHQQMAESVWRLVQPAYLTAISESPAEKPAIDHTEKLPDEDSNLN
ncbi:SGNH/GDSL hydrolase family protein [Planctopirus hydrillae]|uniref:SGNH/GDSL hydrolase family protein n=1 Tax=Planctopirus hydrillae TaxID=1841610 RepID=UPI0009F3BDBE|nr:GDSL-type esterase/lipase family protein [Planctopirus hydrillae]